MQEANDVWIEEDRLRCSEEWQLRYAKLDDDLHRAKVTVELQSVAIKSVLKHLTDDEVDKALAALHNARLHFQNDETVYKPVYIRYDRSRAGHLTAGSTFPDTCLYDPQTQSDVWLYPLVHASNDLGRPLVLIAASAS